MKMTFPQFQDSKIHVTDDEQKQAIIYLQNSDDYDPSNHYSNYWHIEITDNGVGWQNKQSDSGHGLVNIKERLRLLFNEEWTMDIESSEGVTVIVTFPLEEK